MTQQIIGRYLYFQLFKKKLIEKHVTKYLFVFSNKYDLLHKSQSGFRKHHSCNTALIKLVDTWLKSIENGELVGAILIYEKHLTL